MAVEAHRLIAVSLGKLASSRSQRGGVRLHKSLLVAGVLINARSACIQARHRPSVSDLDSGLQQSDTEEDEEYENSDEDDCEYSDDDEIGSRNISDDVSLFEVDHSTTAHTVVVVGSTSPIRSSDIAHKVCDDEISPKDSCRDILELVSSVPCPASLSEDLASKRICSKRPREDDEDLGAKKVRYELELDYLQAPQPSPLEHDGLISTLTSCSSSTDSATNTEPMDCMQMSNLVHSFSAGFSGLLRGVGEPPCERYKGIGSYGSDILHETEHRSATSESIISCSTQIREALETLSRPILAMTV